jgi:hypothetical protein
MKIKVDEVIRDYDNMPIKDKDTNGQERDLTVKVVLAVALNSQLRDEILTSEDKAKIYQLCTKIYSSKEPELTLDDRSFVKQRAEKVLPPLWLGRISDILEENKA